MTYESHIIYYRQHGTLVLHYNLNSLKLNLLQIGQQ